MKTYILRDPQTVEPQSKRSLQPSDPQAAIGGALPPEGAAAATTAQILAPVPLAVSGQARALFIGLDVHTDSIAVSLGPSDSTEVRRYGLIGGSHGEWTHASQH